jgi:hypothetical protein
VLGLHEAATVRPRRSGWPAPSTSCWAGCRTRRSTAGSTPAPVSTMDCPSRHRGALPPRPRPAVVEALSRANLPTQIRSHDRLSARRAWPRSRASSVRAVRAGPVAGRPGTGGRAQLASGRPRLFEVDGTPRPCCPSRRVLGGRSCLCRWPPGAATTWRRSCRRWRPGPRGRARPAGAGGHSGDAARRQGPGVAGGVPGRVRGRPAAATPARRDADRGRHRRGAAAVLRRADPRASGGSTSRTAPAGPGTGRSPAAALAVPGPDRPRAAAPRRRGGREAGPARHRQLRLI